MSKPGIHWPGNMGYVMPSGSYQTGCTMKAFSHVDEANAFFNENDGLLVVGVVPTNSFGCIVIYTKTLDAAEQAEIQKHGSVIQETLDKFRQQLADNKAKEEEEAQRREEDNMRLMKLGKIYDEKLKALNALPDSKEKKKALITLREGNDAEVLKASADAVAGGIPVPDAGAQ